MRAGFMELLCGVSIMTVRLRRCCTSGSTLVTCSELSSVPGELVRVGDELQEYESPCSRWPEGVPELETSVAVVGPRTSCGVKSTCFARISFANAQSSKSMFELFEDEEDKSESRRGSTREKDSVAAGDKGCKGGQRLRRS